MANWLWSLLEYGREGHTYNIGSDQIISIKELAYLVRDLLAPEKPVHKLGKPNPLSIRNRYIPDITKVRTMHNLHVTIPLEQAITTTANSHIDFKQ